MKSPTIMNDSLSKSTSFISALTLMLWCGLTFAATATNRSPTIAGTPALKVKVGDTFNFTPTAKDLDGDPLTFNIANKPAWLQFNTSTGALTGTPSAANIGLISIGYVISVSDSKGGTSKLPAFNMLVQAAATANNTPPVISGVPIMKANVGTPFSFTPTARDANNDPLTFSIANKPVWASFNPATGALTGTPTGADVGLSPKGYVISVSDGKGGSAALSAFNINVLGNATVVNTPPVISGTPVTNVASGIAYSFTPSARDTNNDALTFSITNKPAWASFDSATGKLSGNPTVADIGSTSGIVIGVTDGKSAPVNFPAFNITVSGPINLAKEFGIASQGGTYSGIAAIRAIDGDNSTSNHTTCDINNWWQVSLPQPAQINKIVVRNHTSNRSRLNGASVYVTNVPYTSAAPGAAEQVATLTETTTDQVTTFTSAKTGRYVIVKAAGIECLHMREVEVYGELQAAPAFDQAAYNALVSHSAAVGTDVATVKAVDYQLQPVSYAIEGAVPFAIDATGKITLNGIVQPASTYSFNVAASDGINTSRVVVTVKSSALDALAVALQTADASNITASELIDSGIALARSEVDYCTTELAKIYPTSLAQSVFPSRSAYFNNTTPRNVALHVSSTTGKPAVYSWLGKKENGTPYAVLGTNVFAFSPNNTDLKDSTLNVFRWLLNRSVNDNILNEALIIVVPNSGDRTDLAKWFTDNGLQHKWTITSDTSLLGTGNFDLYLAEITRPLSQIQQAFAVNKPVLVFNQWYEPPAATLSEFDLSWSWFGSRTVGNLTSVADQCNKTTDSSPIHQMLTNLKTGLPDFVFEPTDCPVDDAGKTICATDKVTDAAGNSIDTLFLDAVSVINSQLKSLDEKGTNLFSLGDNRKLLKIATLLADKYRAEIKYPMDKFKTADNAFFHAMYADNVVHYARPNNTMQQDLGLFTDAQSVLNAQPTTTLSVTLTPTSYNEWTSTGIYLPPGKTITVRRTDNSAAAVKLRGNFVRRTTRLWQTNGYNRPLKLASNDITLAVGKTYTISTPYGGPAYLNWDAVPTGAVPFTVEFSNVIENPMLTAFDSSAIQTFLSKVETTNSDWIDIKTPFAEVHSLKSHLLKAFAEQDGDGANGYTIQDVIAYTEDLNNYLITGNYALAGFNGVGLPALTAGTVAFCDRVGLSSVLYAGANTNLCASPTIHRKPSIQHINADLNAACGALCSGNPFDSGGFIEPLGWGDNHEMGHNLQRGRLKIYEGRSGEVSNNIFPLYTLSTWAQNQGFTKHPTERRPSNNVVFNLLQGAIKAGAPVDINNPVWANGSNIYANAMDRLAFFQQLAYTHKSWDFYTKLYLMERIFADAITSEAKWNAVKNILGFGNYILTDANGVSLNATKISGNDFMYIAASVVDERNYSDFFDAWGVATSQTAKDQVAANNISVQVPKQFYYVNNELPVTFPTDADTIPLDGTRLWVDPTP